MAKANDFGSTGLWVRVNALNSPWFLDDMTRIVAEIGDKLDVVMLPKVEGPWDIHFIDQYLALLEARHGVEEADPRPRDPGDRRRRQQCRRDRRGLAAHARHEPRARRSRRLARDEDDAGRRRPSRLSRARRSPARRRGAAERAAGPLALHDRAHGRRLRGQRPEALLRPVRRFLRSRGLRDRSSATPSCSAAPAPGRCIPSQIAIAKQVFSPDPGEVAFARKILAAMPDGSGAVMIDGKMQDDATWKQARVIVDLARQVAARGQGIRGAIRIRATRRKIDRRAAAALPSAFHQSVSVRLMQTRIAKFGIGQVVKHRVYPFRGVIFDVDPIFANTEEWWRSIPAEVRPSKDQPFYHLYAENAESQYIAYVSEQNLLPDESGEPVRHPQVDEVFRAHRERRLPPARQVDGELTRS